MTQGGNDGGGGGDDDDDDGGGDDDDDDGGGDDDDGNADRQFGPRAPQRPVRRMNHRAARTSEPDRTFDVRIMFQLKFISMTRDQIMSMSVEQLEEECSKVRERGEVLVAKKYLDLAAVWPLWEAARSIKTGWALTVDSGRCVIIERHGNQEWIVVPSGEPAEAIRRAFLLATMTPA